MSKEFFENDNEIGVIDAEQSKLDKIDELG